MTELERWPKVRLGQPQLLVGVPWKLHEAFLFGSSFGHVRLRSVFSGRGRLFLNLEHDSFPPPVPPARVDEVADCDLIVHKLRRHRAKPRLAHSLHDGRARR
jgi:hypothetical protein